MTRRIQSALISVFYKDGLEPLVRTLHSLGVKLYSTGGTQSFIEGLGLPCTAVESVTDYPSILGGRVKTLHPKIFGGILQRRGHTEDEEQAAQYGIPPLDLVIVDLYPFEETVASGASEEAIVEKIDIGGVSLIRAAAKNYKDVCIVAARSGYAPLLKLLEEGGGETTGEDRQRMAAAAFTECAHYDTAIARYFNPDVISGAYFQASTGHRTPLRYGENPHQQASFYGDLSAVFTQLHGKELSYNNLVDVDAACAVVDEFSGAGEGDAAAVFAVIKHTNVCGFARRSTVEEAWSAALAGDKESAFGGVLATSATVTEEAATAIHDIFFEILLAPGFTPEALAVLQTKKNRILIQRSGAIPSAEPGYKRILNGVLAQSADVQNFERWESVGARNPTPAEDADLKLANVLCKHLKSNAIALVKDGQLIGKGCGQTSRIDALRHAVEKAKGSGFSTEGAVLASDAFFPFDDCARLAHAAGITAIVQPGGSIRDKDTVAYCVEAGLALVMTGTRHFRH